MDNVEQSVDERRLQSDPTEDKPGNIKISRRKLLGVLGMTGAAFAANEILGAGDNLLQAKSVSEQVYGPDSSLPPKDAQHPSPPQSPFKHNVLADRDMAEAHPASAIVDVSGKSQQQINDNQMRKNGECLSVKDYGAVASEHLVSDWYSVGSPNYKGYADLAAVQADYPFIVDGSESIDYVAFQANVYDSIFIGTNKIFIPFDNAEKYYLNRTVKIPASGFLIEGNRTPSYHVHNQGGYIYANETVTNLFNYGVGGAYASNQLTLDGIAMLGKGGKTQTFMLHDANNNGPHRGVALKNCSGRDFDNIIKLDPTNPTYLSAANVVVDGSCCFINNNNVVNAVQRLFGMRISGIQSEQGARYTGYIDGGVTVVDNMLEGQSNPITIESNQPSVVIQNNYFEAISGDYLSKTKGTNVNAIFDERPNYISSINSTDIHRLSGVVRLHAPYAYHIRNDRHSLYSLIGANLAIGSKFSGAAYIGTTDSTDGAAGFCDPTALQAARSTAKFQKFIGSDVLDTPTGKTYSGLKSTGTSAFITINAAGWNVGDIVTAVALVKIPYNVAPTMSIYANTGEVIGALGQNTMMKMADGWHIMFISRAAAVASTTTRFKFVSTAEIQVAAVGVDVTPQADFKTFNGIQRAEIQVFNPLQVNAETHTYRDVRTLIIPAIAAGASYTTASISVFGAAVGDAVVCTPNTDTQGLDWFARVSAAHTIELRIVNRTGAGVTLDSVQWNTRVFK
ncbi:hypothetical protein FE783_37010 [Paenibacillus mesophilus]|uniref:hypothetical protein n=1 Tax=Paenibacillus mesophilus TaxID=2582849 RepID=UPI00110E6E80|nr:hypothetical protein [Paenibacillus mesophilus]TMV42741.1 hypothetical protein FE783_37010 [Paenibacillus mesophilus]